jgi:uncharacterized protein (TIGR01370 family)
MKTLSEVNSLIYVITNDIREPGFDRLIDKSNYDLVIQSVPGNSSAEQIKEFTKVANSSKSKIIVGYFCFTEASEYNNPDLFLNNKIPDWFGKVNPEWMFSYSVQYWRNEWLNEIKKRIDIFTSGGFDGIFLDAASGDSGWLLNNIYGNSVNINATKDLVTLLSNMKDYIASKNLQKPFYIIANQPYGIANNYPNSLNLLDAVFNEVLYFKTTNTTDNNTANINTIYGAPYLDYITNPNIPNTTIIFGNDYPDINNLNQSFNTFSVYSKLGWVSSVQDAKSTLKVILNGPYLTTATINSPIVNANDNLISFLGGGIVKDSTLIGGKSDDWFVNGLSSTTMYGNGGNDQFHIDIGTSKVLKLNVTAFTTDLNNLPSLELYVNGEKYNNAMEIKANYRLGSSQELIFDLAKYSKIESVIIKSNNLFYKDTNNYADLFLTSINFRDKAIDFSKIINNGKATYNKAGGNYLFMGGGEISFDNIDFSNSNNINFSNIDGGSEIDKICINSNSSLLNIKIIKDLLTITDSISNNVVCTATTVERIQFTDVSIAIDLNGNAGITAKILGAVFGKESLSNRNYVGIGLHFLDAGWTYDNLAGLALDAAGAKTNDQIVSLLWTNVIGTKPSG